MANEIFVVTKSPDLTLNPTERTLAFDGFTCDEPALRAWMASAYLIPDGIPMRAALSFLSTFGWTVLMAFPADPVAPEIAAAMRLRVERKESWSSSST